MFMKSRFVLLLLMALPALAPAADTPWVAWTTDATKSTVEFQFVQAGAKTEGRFTQFTVDMDFDPAKPADGKIEVTIDMGSADTRD
ncbi:MAG: YceI family protein, partial [Nevskiaceae bacterium]|nr:YceI family protein [Nevskiaceae bacterium]